MLALAVALVRSWTWLYTWSLHPAVRDGRRAEIESDLWESQVDALRERTRPRAVAAQVVVRLLLGIPDDLLWRFERRREEEASMGRVLWITGTVIVLATSAIWVGSQLRAPQLPMPPDFEGFVSAPPRPPAPPPPPPPPPPPYLKKRDSLAVGDSPASKTPRVPFASRPPLPLPAPLPGQVTSPR